MSATQNLQRDKPTADVIAMDYALHGRYVIPCWGVRADGSCRCRAGNNCDRVGKHPLVASYSKAATRNTSVIRLWAEKWPSCNWAWLPFKSGLAGIDMDRRNGGEDSLIDLKRDFGPLPETERNLTGDGQHSIFLVPDDWHPRSTELAPGLELKAGSSSYLMIPGSRHLSGFVYEMEEGYGLGQIDVAKLPRWIVGIISRKPPSANLVVPSELRGFDTADCPYLNRSRLAKHLEPGTRLFTIFHQDPVVGNDVTRSGFTFKLFRELHRLGYDLFDAHPVAVEMFQDKDYSPLLRNDWVVRTWLNATAVSPRNSEATPDLKLKREMGIVAAYRSWPRILKAGGNSTYVLALGTLATYATHGVCFISGARLAGHIGSTPRHANRVLGWLEENRFINRLSEPRRAQHLNFARVWDLRFLSTEQEVE